MAKKTTNNFKNQTLEKKLKTRIPSGMKLIEKSLCSKLDLKNPISTFDRIFVIYKINSETSIGQTSKYVKNLNLGKFSETNIKFYRGETLILTQSLSNVTKFCGLMNKCYKIVIIQSVVLMF